MLALAVSACTAHADGHADRTPAFEAAQNLFADVVYPGAASIPPGAYVATDADGTRTIAGYTTTAAFEKVYAYYRHVLPPGAETMHVLSPNGSVATFATQSADARSLAVQISSDKPNVTEILLTSYPRRPPSRPPKA